MRSTFFIIVLQFMYVAGMYVCGHVLWVFLDYSPLYLLKQSLSLDLYLANSG